MSKYDPHGVFLNKFGRRLLGTLDDADVDPLVTHCALQDYCRCQQDHDCGTGQSCLIMENTNNRGTINVCRDS